MLPLGFWRFAGKKLSSGTRPVSRHFPFCPYTTGALPAIALVLIPEGVELGSPKSVESLLEESLENLAVSPATPTPLIFTARTYGDLSSWPGTAGCVVWPRGGILPS